MKRPGLFISIEGGEGAGKSTLIRHLQDFFETIKYPCLVTREPGGTVFAERARELLLSFSQEHWLSPETEILLVLAARSDHVEKVIRPALEHGKVVLSDRYIDSTMAYQGYGRKRDPRKLWSLCVQMVPLLPELTFYLDLSPQEAQVRLTGRQKEMRDRMESEDEGFHRRVREGFLALKKTFPHRIVFLDAFQTAEEIADKAITIIKEKLLS
jgi:dTMP kinase